jgi:hypothetical protein
MIQDMSRFRTTPRKAVARAIAAMIVYVASLGPGGWLVCHFCLPKSAVAIILTIFQPLELLAEMIPPLKDLLGLYMYFWIGGEIRESPPAEPIPFLGCLFGIVLASWFIWNVVGWFSSRGDIPATRCQP